LSNASALKEVLTIGCMLLIVRFLDAIRRRFAVRRRIICALTVYKQMPEKAPNANADWPKIVQPAPSSTRLAFRHRR
jgi:hypothetical protein